MENSLRIVVFGATGKIGWEVINHLSKACMPTIAVTRHAGKAVAMPFVEWMEGDMLDRNSLAPILAKSKTIFLASAMNEDIVQAQCNVIEMASIHGAGHIVKLSSGAANSNSPLYVAKVHGEIEECLTSSGINATILRPNGFMQNWLYGLAQTVKQQRKIYEATGDGKRAYIDLRDIAEVAFTILKKPARHVCHAYNLTGGEAINYHQLAKLITTTIGEEITYAPITIEDMRQRMEQKGLPTWAIETFLGYATEQREGKAGWVSTDVPDILQRPARTVESFIAENVRLFK